VVVAAVVGGLFFFQTGIPAGSVIPPVVEVVGEDDDEMRLYGAIVLGGKSSPLLDFPKESYDAVGASGKLIVLSFYANWCPICKEETANALYPAFNALAGEGVIGFRVNYNDDETDDDERSLAREFGVAYQHTKVFVKDGARVLKSPEGWTKERYLTEIATFTK
jgi:thiol-disulfide isomerase/thioredoxin